MNLQQAIDAPRVRLLDGRRVSIESHPTVDLAAGLSRMGHAVEIGEEIPTDWTKPHDFGRSFEGSAQAIMLGKESLCGASDPRLDGIAVGV